MPFGIDDLGRSVGHTPLARLAGCRSSIAFPCPCRPFFGLLGESLFLPEREELDLTVPFVGKAAFGDQDNFVYGTAYREILMNYKETRHGEVVFKSGFRVGFHRTSVVREHNTALKRSIFQDLMVAKRSQTDILNSDDVEFREPPANSLKNSPLKSSSGQEPYFVQFGSLPSFLARSISRVIFGGNCASCSARILACLVSCSAKYASTSALLWR